MQAFEIRIKQCRQKKFRKIKLETFLQNATLIKLMNVFKYVSIPMG